MKQGPFWIACCRAYESIIFLKVKSLKKEKKSTRLDLQGLENRTLTSRVGCLNSDTISDLNELTWYVLIARISFLSCLLESQKVKALFFFGSERKLRTSRSSLSLWECSPLPGAENLVAHPLTVRKAGRQRRWNFKRWKRMKTRRWRKELFVSCNCTPSTDNGLQRPFILHLWTPAWRVLWLIVTIWQSHFPCLPNAAISVGVNGAHRVSICLK